MILRKALQEAIWHLQMHHDYNGELRVSPDHQNSMTTRKVCQTSFGIDKCLLFMVESWRIVQSIFWVADS